MVTTSIALWVRSTDLALDEVYRLLLELNLRFSELSVEVFTHASANATLFVAELMDEHEGEVDLASRWAKLVSRELGVAACGLLNIETLWEAKAFEAGRLAWEHAGEDRQIPLRIFERLSREAGRAWDKRLARNGSEANLERLLSVGYGLTPLPEEWKVVGTLSAQGVRAPRAPSVPLFTLGSAPIDPMRAEGDRLTVQAWFHAAREAVLRQPEVRVLTVMMRARVESWAPEARRLMEEVPPQVERFELRFDDGALAFERSGGRFRRLLVSGSFSSTELREGLQQVSGLDTLVLETQDTALSWFAEDRGMAVSVGATGWTSPPAPSAANEAAAATVLSWLKD